MTVGLARVAIGLRQGAEEVRLAVTSAGRGRRTHHHQVRSIGLPQDRVADVRRLAQDRLRASLDVLADERGEGVLRLRPHRQRDSRRHEMEDDDLRVVAARDGVGEADRQLRVGAAADRHEDAPDLARPALLDDGDVARRVADDLVDGRREDAWSLPVPAGR